MSSPPRTVTAPVLSGDSARRWIARQGWAAEGGERFQLASDHLADPSFSLSLIWHSSALLSRSDESRSDSVLILVGIDGSAEMSADGRVSALEARGMIIADADAPLTLSFSEASTRLEVIMKKHQLGATRLLLTRDVEVVTIEEGYWRTLSTLIVTVLRTGVNPRDRGFEPLKSAIQHTITAAIMHSPLNAHSSPGSHGTLLSEARRIIDGRFDDPSFSTGGLARELAISAAHLHRIFASAPATPYQLIQQLRVGRATELMRTTHLAPSSLAAQSGFRSPRAMRRAIRTHTDAGAARGMTTDQEITSSTPEVSGPPRLTGAA